MPHLPAPGTLSRLWLAAWFGSGLGAQQGEPEPARAAAPPTTASAATARTAPLPTRPTHAPRPELPPLLALQHVQQGNAAVAAAVAAGLPPPRRADRPAGAGRYVCAVLACADCDVDVPALLGLARTDVLLLSLPGPYVTPEAMALLERAVAAERLALVLVLGHAGCTSLRHDPLAAASDPLVARRARVDAEARRRGQPLAKTLVQLQCELLLATSEPLRLATARDAVRILPGEIEPRRSTITWHFQRADGLPLAPVK